MLKNSEEEKFKLEAKMESTEKYWINKVKGLEENYRTLLDKLESSRKDVESAEKNLTVLNEENKRVSFKNGLG
jgi:outer membrane protein TolC